MEISPRSRLLLAFGAGCFLIGGAAGWLLRGEAPPSPARHEATNAPKRPVASEESSGLAPLLAASAPGEESGGRAAATLDFVAEARGAMSEVDEWDRLRRLHAAIDRLGPADIEAAVAQVRLLPQGDRWQAALVLGERWAHFDPIAALAYAKMPGSGEVGRAIADGAFQKWMAVAPDAVRAWLATLPTGPDRTSFIQTFARKLARRDPAAALQMLEALPASQRGDWAYPQVFSAWATDNPQAAATAAIQLPRAVRDSVIKNLAGTWADKDPIAALAWASQLDVESTRRNAVQRIVDTWSGTDPAAAVAWVLQNYPPTGNENTLGHPYANWMASAPNDAIAWALALPAGQTHDGCVWQSIENLVTTDPQRAVELFRNNLPAKLRDQNAGWLAGRWADSDPAAAAAWAGQLPPGEWRDAALRQVAFYWAASDPAGAARWVDRVPAAQGRDAVVVAYSEQTVEADPEAALVWAATIGDENMRKNSIVNLVTQWQKNDPAAARKWIAGSGLLTAEQKAGLLKKE